MAETKREQSDDTADNFVDAGRMTTGIYQPDAEVQQEFAEAQRLTSGRQKLVDRLREHNSQSPELSGGDIDADWDKSHVGEEAVGGGNPTPDQDVVEELGQAVGLTYEDNEELDLEGKIYRRDHDRWELDPASSEDYQRRVNHEGE
jgi:hypothetical protein